MRHEQQHQQHQPQPHGDDDDVDGIEDFEGDSPPRIPPPQRPPPTEAPPQLQPTSAARPTATPQRRIPPQSARKRKNFYDDIDPDLLASAAGHAGGAIQKKPKRGLAARDSRGPACGRGGECGATPVPVKSRTDKRAPAPKPVQGRGPARFPAPAPQAQSRNAIGFGVDPDLLAAASPLRARGKSQRAVEGWKPRATQAVAGRDSSSKVLWPRGPFQSALPQTAGYKSAPSDDVVPETSPPDSPASPPPQTPPLPSADSQVSISDSIEDQVSPRNPHYHSLKNRDLDILHSDIDIASSPPLSPSSHPSFKPTHAGDASASGDSVPDPDSMALDDAGSPPPAHTHLPKRPTQQPATPAPQTPRPGYMNISDLRRSIAAPRAGPPPPLSDPQHHRFTPGGLADTVLGWKKELHSTSVFKRIVEETDRDYVITVTEAVKDRQMILIKGHGEEGVVRAIVSGFVGRRLQVTVGQVVKYRKPWVTVDLVGEEGWRCLMGKIEVQDVDGDVEMAE